MGVFNCVGTCIIVCRESVWQHDKTSSGWIWWITSGKTILTALRQGLIRVVAAVVVRVTGPFRLDALAVLTFELVVTTRTGCR